MTYEVKPGTTSVMSILKDATVEAILALPDDTEVAIILMGPDMRMSIRIFDLDAYNREQVQNLVGTTAERALVACLFVPPTPTIPEPEDFHS